MKKTISLLLCTLPLLVAAQCFNPLSTDTTIAMQLKPVVEKYTAITLESEPVKRIFSAYTFGYYSADNTAGLTISINRTKTEAVDGFIYTDPNVFRVLIYGTAEAMDKMFAEYFTPLLANCQTKQNANLIFTPNIKVVKLETDKHEGKQMKTIEIEKYK